MLRFWAWSSALPLTVTRFWDCDPACLLERGFRASGPKTKKAKNKKKKRLLASPQKIGKKNLKIGISKTALKRCFGGRFPVLGQFSLFFRGRPKPIVFLLFISGRTPEIPSLAGRQGNSWQPEGSFGPLGPTVAKSLRNEFPARAQKRAKRSRKQVKIDCFSTIESSYRCRLEGIFSKFFSPCGPDDFPGKTSKIIRTGDFCPIHFFGGTWYWYANCSSLFPALLRILAPKMLSHTPSSCLRPHVPYPKNRMRSF